MNQWRPSAPPPSGGGRSHGAGPTSGRPPAGPPGQQAPAPRGPVEPQRADPEGMQSVLSRARDQSRYEAPVIEEERRRGPLPWKAVLVVFLTVMALGAGLGAVYALVLREPTVPENTLVAPPSDAPMIEVRTPQDAARDYLEALATGDIEAALELGEPGGNGSRALLTPEAHAATREQAPIQDIEIVTQDPNASQVEVSYTLAGTPVTTTIPVVLDDSGSYRLERTTVTVVIEMGSAEALPLLVNGTEVPQFTPLEVVPGSYTLSTGLPFIEYPSENAFTVGSLQFAEETSFTATPRLTALGVEAFRTAAQRSLEQCLAARVAQPEGCPQGVTPAKPIAPDTIRWSVVGNPLSQGDPSLSTDDLTVATMALEMQFRLTFTYADGSNPGNPDYLVSTRARANMLGADEHAITVVWER